MASIQQMALCIIQFVKANSATSMQNEFLGALTKLQKVTISLVTSVYLSAWNHLVPTGWIFMNFM
jgi:hypothetical protein